MANYAPQGFSCGSFGTLDLGTAPQAPKDELDEALDEIFFEKQAAGISKLLSEDDAFDFETCFEEKDGPELTQEEIEAFGADGLTYVTVMMQKIEEQYPIDNLDLDPAIAGAAADPYAAGYGEPANTFELGISSGFSAISLCNGTGAAGSPGAPPRLRHFARSFGR